MIPLFIIYIGFTALALACEDIPDDLLIQAGYHVIWSYPGTTLPEELINATKLGHVGGIILFSENVDDGLADNIQTLQSAYAESPASCGKPLLITTDQEGGEVKRVPGGPTLSEKDIGASADPGEEASTAGTQAYEALQPLGINSNLAPVLDVYRTPGDFDDQYERSYSNSSSIVSTCGAAFISSQQSKGVVATGKHFPGLGAATASEDTDVEPVTLNLSLHELRTVDEAPYIPAIQNDVAMVMTSWAIYPALDSKRPAGLSSAWIQHELRGRLGFQGITISDAIEAGALEAFGSNATRAILATEAGLDLILAAALDPSQGAGIVSGLADALSNGTLSCDAFSTATERIVNFRKTLF